MLEKWKKQVNDKENDLQSYVTENQCLEMLKGYKELNRTKMKRILPEILDKYSLQRIRANKKIKEKYGVVSNGYPIIIVGGENF